MKENNTWEPKELLNLDIYFNNKNKNLLKEKQNLPYYRKIIIGDSKEYEEINNQLKIENTEENITEFIDNLKNSISQNLKLKESKNLNDNDSTTSQKQNLYETTSKKEYNYNFNHFKKDIRVSHGNGKNKLFIDNQDNLASENVYNQPNSNNNDIKNFRNSNFHKEIVNTPNQKYLKVNDLKINTLKKVSFRETMEKIEFHDNILNNSKINSFSNIQNKKENILPNQKEYHKENLNFKKSNTVFENKYNKSIDKKLTNIDSNKNKSVKKIFNNDINNDNDDKFNNMNTPKFYKSVYQNNSIIPPTINKPLDNKNNSVIPPIINKPLDNQNKGLNPSTINKPLDNQNKGLNPSTINKPLDNQNKGLNPSTINKPLDNQNNGLNPPIINKPLDNQNNGLNPPIINKPKVDTEKENLSDDNSKIDNKNPTQNNNILNPPQMNNKETNRVNPPKINKQKENILEQIDNKELSIEENFKIRKVRYTNDLPKYNENIEKSKIVKNENNNDDNSKLNIQFDNNMKNRNTYKVLVEHSMSPNNNIKIDRKSVYKNNAQNKERKSIRKSCLSRKSNLNILLNKSFNNGKLNASTINAKKHRRRTTFLHNKNLDNYYAKTKIGKDLGKIYFKNKELNDFINDTKEITYSYNIKPYVKGTIFNNNDAKILKADTDFYIKRYKKIEQRARTPEINNTSFRSSIKNFNRNLDLDQFCNICNDHMHPSCYNNLDN